MNKISLWVAVSAVAMLLVPFAIGQNVTLTSPGDNPYDGVYVSPYFATVNGAINTPIVCDDFADDSHLNTGWTGNIQSFSNLSTSLSDSAWGSKGGTLQLYEEAAWLTIGLLQQPDKSVGQVDYSFAVWAVLDPSGVVAWLKRYGDTATCNAIFGAGNNCLSTNVTGGLLGAAQGQTYTIGEFANVYLITPEVNGATCAAGSCPEQEFFEVVGVPEGGAALAYLLLAGVSCLGAMYLRARQRVRVTRA